MTSIHTKVVGLLGGVAALAAASSASAASPAALTLEHGWVAGTAQRAPGVMKVGDFVYLEGGMANPTNSDLLPFKLAEKYRPASDVYVNVDLPCIAESARLYIAASTGNVSVESYPGNRKALCGVSLDGVSFSTTVLKETVTLTAGWTGAAFGTFIPALVNLSGITHLQGGLDGSGGLPVFTFHEGFAPVASTYVNTNLVGDAPGYLAFDTAGDANAISVVNSTDAGGFTSLDGVVFANKVLDTPLTLENGWVTYPGFASPAVELIDGVVYFQGAIESGSGTIAKLPANLKPTEQVYMQVVGNGGYGVELHVDTSGNVIVDSSDLSDPSAFMSLDGAAFVLDATP